MSNKKVVNDALSSDRPMTIPEIQKKTGVKESEIVSILADLVSAKKITKFRMNNTAFFLR